MALSQSGNCSEYARVQVSVMASGLWNPMMRITDRIVEPALRRTCSVRPESMPAPIHWNQRDSFDRGHVGRRHRRSR